MKMLSAVYGKPYGLNLVNGVVFTITGQGCGGVPNAVYAYNTVTKKVSSSSPPQGGSMGYRRAGDRDRWNDLLRVGRSSVRCEDGTTLNKFRSVYICE